ncbi:MAG: hypothetical protein CR989_05100 [Flavobacteriales bacterium]|nr:MAG: hypothetical protein CR989_05100 [Flavobacteriales bacterium]
MKKIYLLIFAAVLFSLSAKAQDFDDIDETPHDIVYYRTSKISPPLIKVTYGRPAKHNQVVFGNKVPYNKIWRTGDNEATEIKFYKDILFGDVKIVAGTYSLFTIPNKNEWQIILNAQTDIHGACFYNPKLNLAKITVPVKNAEELEYFSIGFKNKKNGVDMVLAWDTVRVSVPISIKHQSKLLVKR